MEILIGFVLIQCSIGLGILFNLNKSKKYKYSIVPVSYKDYNELIDELNELEKDGYIIISEVERYANSPLRGVVTIDFICKQLIK